MYMRIVWGKIVPGQWDEFNKTFEAAIAERGDVKGLRNHWLARDQHDPDSGYSITLWDSEADMRTFWDSQKRKDLMAPLERFYVNQYTVSHCEVTCSTVR